MSTVVPSAKADSAQTTLQRSVRPFCRPPTLMPRTRRAAAADAAVSNISELPDELLLHTLSDLSPASLQAAAAASRKWSFLSRHPALWETHLEDLDDEYSYLLPTSLEDEGLTLKDVREGKDEWTDPRYLEFYDALSPHLKYVHLKHYITSVLEKIRAEADDAARDFHPWFTKMLAANFCTDHDEDDFTQEMMSTVVYIYLSQLFEGQGVFDMDVSATVKHGWKHVSWSDTVPRDAMFEILVDHLGYGLKDPHTDDWASLVFETGSYQFYGEPFVLGREPWRKTKTD